MSILAVPRGTTNSPLIIKVEYAQNEEAQNEAQKWPRESKIGLPQVEQEELSRPCLARPLPEEVERPRPARRPPKGSREARLVRPENETQAPFILPRHGQHWSKRYILTEATVPGRASLLNRLYENRGLAPTTSKPAEPPCQGT